MLRRHDGQLDDARELALDRGEPRVGDARRERVDDEDAHLHCLRAARNYAGVAAHPVEQQRREAVGELVRVGVGPQPGVGPVDGRERDERGRAVVEIGAQLASLAPFAEERAEALLVAAALGDEAVAALALEVAPLADEDGRDVELLRDDARGAPRSAARIRSTTGPSSGTSSSAAWNASAPSRATSQSRSAFDSMCE